MSELKLLVQDEGSLHSSCSVSDKGDVTELNPESFDKDKLIVF